MMCIKCLNNKAKHTCMNQSQNLSFNISLTSTLCYWSASCLLCSHKALRDFRPDHCWAQSTRPIQWYITADDSSDALYGKIINSQLALQVIHTLPKALFTLGGWLLQISSASLYVFERRKICLIWMSLSLFSAKCFQVSTKARLLTSELMHYPHLHDAKPVHQNCKSKSGAVLLYAFLLEGNTLCMLWWSVVSMQHIHQWELS